MSVAQALKTFADEQTEMSFKKAVYEIMHTHWIPCPNCNGEGVLVRPEGNRKCPKCAGSGELEVREDECTNELL